MAPVKLKCTTRDSCNYESQELEFEQANILLESHLKHSHPVQVGGNDGRKLPQFPRPELKLDSSAEEWSEFIVTWNQFKEEYNLEGPSLIRQLFACCSEDLRHSLSRTTGGSHFAKTEAELLNLMKQLSVRYQNPAVHVQEFLGLVQHQDEGVRHFLTRLRGVAARCNFTTKCSCNREVSYADSMIRFKMIAGLYDSEIKEDILSSEDKTLDETVKTIEAKESGKIARRTVGASNANPVASVKPVVKTPVRCGHCNRTEHSSKDRTWQNCPAFDKDCSNCGNWLCHLGKS